MHLDDILPNVANEGAEREMQPVGCSTIMCNQAGQVSVQLARAVVEPSRISVSPGLHLIAKRALVIIFIACFRNRQF